MKLRFVFTFAAALSTIACTQQTTSTASDSGTPVEGMHTGSTCPTGSTLTYDNFARPFAEQYCVRCHSSTLTGDARHGAPEFHDFDTEQGILDVAEHVDQQAAAGPDAVNTLMPYDTNGPAPTVEERRRLGEWLACEMMAAAGDGGTTHGADAGH